MNIKYNIIAFVFISLFVISCGKKMQLRKLNNQKLNRQKKIMRRAPQTIAELTKNK
jgi:membrane protein implicated in regulation of membrane protease activity